MRLETLGHASLLLRGEDGEPLLLTDPWLTGSCYWRSWWLQHAPSEAEIEVLRGARFCLVTHEHPDHFHPPSLRKLGAGPLYLAPDLPEEKIAGYLRAAGCRAETLSARAWRSLGEGVRVLGLPQPNDDSLVLVDTPRAFLVNLNDCKPSRRLLDALRALMDRHARGKTRVLLSSYSPASLVNSFFRDGARVHLRAKAGYVRYVNAACERLGADVFVPFASQAVFRRADSAWANAYKVRYDDLRASWTSKARLSPPYIVLDLAAPGAPEVSRVPEADYRGPSEAAAEKVAAQERLDEGALEPRHVALLGKKLARAAPLLGLIFPRGISFVSGPTTGAHQTGGAEGTREARFHYDPWTFRARPSSRRGSVAFHVPSAILRDVLETGRFGDLGITMSVRVDLNAWGGSGGARRVYLMFFWITLHDYGHTSGPAAFLRWARAAWRARFANIPAPPGWPGSG